MGGARLSVERVCITSDHARNWPVLRAGRGLIAGPHPASIFAKGIANRGKLGARYGRAATMTPGDTIRPDGHGLSRTERGLSPLRAGRRQHARARDHARPLARRVRRELYRNGRETAAHMAETLNEALELGRSTE